MKNCPFLCTLIFFVLFSFSKTYAQVDESQYYTFQKDSAAYITIDPAKMISANKGNVWVEDTTFNIPIGFNFFFLDHELTEVGINQTNLFMPQRDHYIAAFGNFLMEDRGNPYSAKDDTAADTISYSPISYMVDSSNGSGGKILKIQWQNAGYFFDSSLFLNMQIWLYEGSNNIEIRYGNSKVNLDKSQVFGCGPLVGLAKVDTVKRFDLYEMYLNGDAQRPDTIGLNQAGKRCLNNVPSPGIIYRFVYHDRLGISPAPHSGFSIFPNPVAGQLNIHLAENGTAVLEISDMAGRMVYHQTINSSTAILTSSIGNGVYIVKLSQGQNLYYQKLMVNK